MPIQADHLGFGLLAQHMIVDRKPLAYIQIAGNFGHNIALTGLATANRVHGEREPAPFDHVLAFLASPLTPCVSSSCP